mmetsp:Transcript_8126/g.19456  ORF Transcript_8126/g.19456 Transcript_8126/m.19456 type:complete len:412 (-) Transcript_8126:227-1462(-)
MISEIAAACELAAAEGMRSKEVCICSNSPRQERLSTEVPAEDEFTYLCFRGGTRAPSTQQGRPRRPREAAAAAAGMEEALPALLQATADRGAAEAASLGAAELSTVVRALGALRFRAPAALSALEARCLGGGLVDRMSAEEAAATAWGLSRLGFRSRPLFEALAGRIVLLARDGAIAEQALCMALLAFAKADHRSPRLFREAAKQLRDRSHGLRPSTAAAALHACMKAGRTPDGLLDALSARLAVCYRRATPRELAAAGKALLKASHPATAFYCALAAAVVEAGTEFSAADLATAALVLGRMKCNNMSGVFEAVRRELERRGDEFGEAELRDVCWAFAAAGAEQPPLCEGLPLPEEPEPAPPRKPRKPYKARRWWRRMPDSARQKQLERWGCLYEDLVRKDMNSGKGEKGR